MNKIGISEYVALREKELNQFKEWYLSERENDPEDWWPLFGNVEYWDEQFDSFHY